MARFPIHHLTLRVVFLVAVLSFLVNVWGWDLWAPDEPRNAEVAREMLETGDFLIPHLNYSVYSEKPPLFYWIVCACCSIFGVNAFAVRLISVLCGIGTVWLTVGLARRDAMARLGTVASPPSVRTGIIAGVILATSVMFAWMARKGSIDVALTLCTTAAIVCLHRGANASSLAYPAGAGALMGAACLLKGPLGFFLPMLTYLVWLTVERKWRPMRWSHVATGAACLIVVVGGWLVPAGLAGGREYLRTLVVEQIARRAIGHAQHAKPVWYYVQGFALDFFPWILLFPSAVAAWWRDRGRRDSLPIVWVAVVFLFFSALSGKREIYLLPLLPAASVLVARMIAEESAVDRPSLWWRITSIVASVGLVTGAIALGIVGTRTLGKVLEQWQMAVPADQAFASSVVLPATLILTGGLLFLLGLRRPLRAVSLLGAGLTAFYVVAAVWTLPLVDRFKSARPICEALLAVRRHDETVGLYGDVARSGAYNLYTRLPLVELRDPGELRDFLQSAQPVFCFVPEKAWRALDGAAKEGLTHVGRAPVGRLTMLLVTNRRGETPR